MGSSHGTHIKMSFGSSTSPRFKVAQTRNPGPGTYHSDRARPKSAPAPPGQLSRSGWLKGKMETDQHNGISREGFVGSQKELSSPGPGAYNSRSCFGSTQAPKRAGFLSEAERYHQSPAQQLSSELTFCTPTASVAPSQPARPLSDHMESGAPAAALK